MNSSALLLHLQTANLDGETNLKIRKALERTWDYVNPDIASEFKGLKVLLFTLILLGRTRTVNIIVVFAYLPEKLHHLFLLSFSLS